MLVVTVPRLAMVAATLLSLSVAGCQTVYTYLPHTGPLADTVVGSGGKSPIPVLDITSEVAQRLASLEQRRSFAETLPAIAGKEYTVGPGDGVEVSIWESPPAALFAVAIIDPNSTSGAARPVTLPEQMVASDGTINIPFGGNVVVAGKSIPQIEADIVKRLVGKANDPQIFVRVLHNNTANVTVVGEVGQSIRLPLTTKGERLLDALAAAGGVRQAVSKVSLQITRGGQVATMALDAVIRDPQQNIKLKADDVVTALFQTNSFTALGAIGRNAEVDFEARGISLAQAMGRMAGLQEGLSNAKGVFLFRFEDPTMLPPELKDSPRTPDGKVPMIYRVDFTDPASFLLAQRFPMRNQDVVYAAIAPAVEFQKFLGILGGVEGSVLGVVYATK